MNIEGSLSRILEAPRSVKRAISVMADAALIPLAYFSAKALRLGFISQQIDASELSALAVVLVTTLLVFIRLGLYRAILRYMAPRAITSILLGTTISAFTLVLMGFFFKVGIPRTVPLIYWMLLVILVGGTRFAVRGFIHSTIKFRKSPVIIYGAGAAGSQLASALLHGKEYEPIAFVDDSNELQGSMVQGIRVYTPDELPDLIERLRVSKILLALPSATNSVRKSILLKLEALPVRVQTIAGMADIVSGNQDIAELRDIDVADLLGRDPIAPLENLMEKEIKGKTVMVTGAGGSIGSELCRQIITRTPEVLLLVENSEFALYSIAQEVSSIAAANKLKIKILPFSANVQNRRLMLTIMKRYAVDTVYHAAAYKHVPIVEYNVVEGLQNNVFGTWHTASAAQEAGVKTFVLISTDKAVRPTNVMGATKRLSELCLQALSAKQLSTRFVMVRFGNVLGSSGSVVPLFKKQIQKGGPITVTHQDVIRYFMTIPEAAQLVIQAAALGEGGDVFVLDMGEPVRIIDMAKQMVHLMGLTVKSENHPNGDIEISISGLRPGEKLFEELLIGNDVTGTSHPRILRANEKSMTYEDLNKALESLRLASATYDAQQIRELMISLPLDFSPSSELCDLLSVHSNFAGDSTAPGEIRLS